MLTGMERYKAVVRRVREQHAFEHHRFVAGEIDVLPDTGQAEREAIIAEMEMMRLEIDRLQAIVSKTGHAVGAQMSQRSHDILNGRVPGAAGILGSYLGGLGQ
jgi:hypothetical protein